jgi:hypothetical protein
MNDQKLPPMYSLTAIGVATFLGSALAAGYMLASNYAALGQRRLGVYTVWGSIALVIGFVFLPPQFVTGVTTAIIVLIAQVVLVLLIANQLQGAMFTSFEEMGGSYHPMRRAVWVGIAASLVLTVFWVMISIMFGLGAAPAATP